MHRDSIKLGDISPRNIIHQKSAACTVIFDTLRAKASLTVACNRRLAFVGETRFMLNKHEANRPWRFYKKSPLESRKTTFDFYCLVFHRLLSRYRKTGVHAADFWFIILFEMYRSYLHWSLMDCKIGITLKAILSPCAFFGVLRTFFAWIVKWSATRRRR